MKTLPFLTLLSFFAGALSSPSTLPASAQSPQPTATTRPISVAPNLVQNGDFIDGTDAWMAELSTGMARGTVRVMKQSELAPTLFGRGVHFDVTAIDTQKWHLQFNQGGLSLTPGVAYTLTFWARSDRDRPIEVNFGTDNGDYHMIGLSAPLQLTQRWHQYTFVFTPSDVPPGHARLGFVIGNATGAVELSSVRVARGAAPRILSSSGLQNANFENGAERWILTGDPANVKTGPLAPKADNPDAPTELPATALRVSSAIAAGQSWQAQLSQTFPNLRDGEPYTLTFWAKADRDRSLMVATSTNGGDFHTIGLDSRVNLTTTWRKYAMLFTAGHVESNEVSRLVFSFGDEAGILDLTGMALQPGIAPQFMPAPASSGSDSPAGSGSKGNVPGPRRNLKSHPLIGLWESFHRDVTLTGQTYERYRIFFGADGRGNLKITTTGAQDEKPTRPDIADKFDWDTAGSGPHIVIGKHVYTWTVAPDGTRKKLTLKNYEGKTYILFRAAGK